MTMGRSGDRPVAAVREAVRHYEYDLRLLAAWDRGAAPPKPPVGASDQSTGSVG